MKKTLIILGLILWTSVGHAVCTVTPARCGAGTETCSGSYCTTDYYYIAPTCRCTGTCNTEVFPPGYGPNNCMCKASPN